MSEEFEMAEELEFSVVSEVFENIVEAFISSSGFPFSGLVSLFAGTASSLVAKEIISEFNEEKDENKRIVALNPKAAKEAIKIYGHHIRKVAAGEGDESIKDGQELVEYYEIDLSQNSDAQKIIDILTALLTNIALEIVISSLIAATLPASIPAAAITIPAMIVANIVVKAVMAELSFDSDEDVEQESDEEVERKIDEVIVDLSNEVSEELGQEVDEKSYEEHKEEIEDIVENYKNNRQKESENKSKKPQNNTQTKKSAPKNRRKTAPIKSSPISEPKQQSKQSEQPQSKKSFPVKSQNPKESFSKKSGHEEINSLLNEIISHHDMIPSKQGSQHDHSFTQDIMNKKSDHDDHSGGR